MEQMDLNLFRYQISFFTPNVVYGNIQKAFRRLTELCEKTLNAKPAVIPLPDDAPKEFPRLVLKTESGDKQLSLKLDRIDCVFSSKFENPISEIEVKRFKRDVFQWVLPFISEFKISVNRLGVVIQKGFEIKDEELSAEYVAKKYCQKKYHRQPFGNTRSFELHCLKNYIFLGFEINSWVRIQTLNLFPSNKLIIGVTNDLNHIPLNRDLSEREIKDFVNKANKEADAILEHYKLL